MPPIAAAAVVSHPVITVETASPPLGIALTDINTYPCRTAPNHNPCRTVLCTQVYCSKEKAATLAACGLAPRYANLITTNHLEANIHAVSTKGCPGTKVGDWVKQFKRLLHDSEERERKQCAQQQQQQQQQQGRVSRAQVSHHALNGCPDRVRCPTGPTGSPRTPLPLLQVPLFKVTLDGLSQILDQYRGRYNTIIGFSVRGP